MVRYKVRATMHGRRITTKKYWMKKSLAQRYAYETNKYRRGARAIVIKAKKKRRR